MFHSLCLINDPADLVRFLNEFSEAFSIILLQAFPEALELYDVLLQYIEHIIPVLHENGNPHSSIALGKANSTCKTRRCKFEDGLLLALLLQHRVCKSEGSD